MHVSEHLETVPGVRVVLFAGPLYFANAGEFRARFESLVAQPHLPSALVLDAASMGDIDYTGATTLRAVVDNMMARKIKLVVARAGRTVIKILGDRESYGGRCDARHQRLADAQAGPPGAVSVTTAGTGRRRPAVGRWRRAG